MPTVVIATGELDEPPPNAFCPDVPTPHPYNVPAVVMPILWLSPAVMAFQLVAAGPLTKTGELTVV